MKMVSNGLINTFFFKNFQQQDIDKQKSLEFHDSIIRQPDLIHHNHEEFTSQVEQEFV